MKEITDKIITWVALVIAVLSSVGAIVFALNIESNSSLFDITYWVLLCMVVLSIVAILCFWLIRFAKKLSTESGYWLKALVIVGIVVVACIASYALAKGNDVTPALLEKNGLSENASKLIGAACILVYILVIAAAVAIVATEILKSIKKK